MFIMYLPFDEVEVDITRDKRRISRGRVRVKLIRYDALRNGL
jgi:hypothetical protein